MSRHILKCVKCNNYTMKQICPKCGEKAVSVIPLKYSPDDRMAKYRRMAKEELIEKTV
jgi:H/ACA ribonucleoprotein complex subunit 3